jgi:hypothetical protein
MKHEIDDSDEQRKKLVVTAKQAFIVEHDI